VPVPIQSRGVRLLADGSIVAVDTAKSEVVRIPTSGPDAYTKQVLASGLTNPNGIAVGMDGRVYVSGLAIVRVDPESKTHDVLHTYDGVFGGYDGITFSPDYQTLYFDEEYNDTGARIYRMTFDGDGEVDEVTPIATLPSQVKLDGMTADACGNLYVVEMSGIIWRVTPAGDVAVAADLTGAQIPGGAYLPAVNFGSGVGGWSRTRLYAMNWTGMTDGVFEVDIGVPGKAEPHLGP
jgi:sugar lactone lactonase YvrE